MTDPQNSTPSAVVSPRSQATHLPETPRRPRGSTHNRSRRRPRSRSYRNDLHRSSSLPRSRSNPRPPRSTAKLPSNRSSNRRASVSHHLPALVAHHDPPAPSKPSRRASVPALRSNSGVARFVSSPFSAFSRPHSSSEQQATCHPAPSQQLLRCITVGLTALYRRVNPSFHYDPEWNPRRPLTHPSEPCPPNGCDNENGDLILHCHDLIEDKEGNYGFRVEALVGQGTFGQVVKCRNVHSNQLVAIKIIKNKPAYFTQAFMEIRILKVLNSTEETRSHIVELLGSFMYKNHLCLVFELLGINLYELIRRNHHKGLTSASIKYFLGQLVTTLSLIKQAGIIHCDLKPENILLGAQDDPNIKVIDFGSACYELSTVYTYIQSRYYRAPEVLLNCPYNGAIDSWSLGCIAVELFLGLPLFAGEDETHQLHLIIDMRGYPPEHILAQATKANVFFDIGRNGSEPTYSLKRLSSNAKRPFAGMTLNQVLQNVPMRARPDQIEEEQEFRRRFSHFVSGLLQVDPDVRWNAQDVCQHPLLTGAPFTGTWEPPSAKYRRPRSHTLHDLGMLPRSAPHPMPNPLQYAYHPSQIPSYPSSVVPLPQSMQVPPLMFTTPSQMNYFQQSTIPGPPLL